jgi:DNA-binding transcriptional ArsR family regulator
MTDAPRFDELIHAPTRLSIMSLLGASDWAEFRFIRESLGLSDSALSKQLTLLEEAGYVEIRKAFVGKRPRTWARLSRAGRAAFAGHVQRLREIVAGSGLSLIDGPATDRRPDQDLDPEPAGLPRATLGA